MFPEVRLRRLRKYPWLRDLVAEIDLQPHNLVYPIFITEGYNVKEPIAKMPGIFRLSVDLAITKIKQAASLGIKAVALFPVIPPELKNDSADEAYNLDNLICRTIRLIKAENIEIGIIADVALDPYTSSGHDGIVFDGEIDNDKTIEALCNQALTLAKAGADIIAPSDMMDGRILAIRQYLDSEEFSNVIILSYGAKYASSLYTPFRNALNNTNIISKKTYQLDYRNSKEAMREIELDMLEGADMIMIKPAITYLDIIYQAANFAKLPIFGYQVSGEYSMIMAAADAGYISWKEVMLEQLIAIKRAGAVGILSYAAIEMAELLNK
ncbi:MAG: porphobilinogen synthase [Rickettsiaceae bacterium]|nr:porphobilinogen synthase [Rickettsiaceae bacterium]